MIKIRKKRRKEESGDITPLIDVVFILLIFFMLTAVIAPQGMAVNLPEAESVSQTKETPAVITVTGENKIFFNSQATDLSNLKLSLSILNADVPIMVQGDREIAYGLFVQVMDVIRQSGSHPIVLSAEAKKETP